MRTESAALLAGLLAAACSTYQPPPLPPAQRAVVVPIEHGSEERLYIDSVDGLPVSAASAINLHTDNRGVFLAPGQHTLGLRLQVGTIHREMKVWLPAEAGKAYQIESMSDAYGFSARVVESASG